MPCLFSHVEYCDMHFVYGFCDGNARAAVEEYQRRFPDWRIPSQNVFTWIHQTLRDTGSFPSVSAQSEREVVRTINTWENILQMVQRSPRLSNRRMAMLRQRCALCVMYSAWNPKDNYDMSASVFVVQFNDFMSLKVTLMLSTDINITETTYSCQF